MNKTPIWIDESFSSRETSKIIITLPENFRIVNALDNAKCAIFKNESELKKHPTCILAGIVCIYLSQVESVAIVQKQTTKPYRVIIECPQKHVSSTLQKIHLSMIAHSKFSET